MEELSWSDVGMTVEDFKSQSRDALDKIPYDEYWWTCCVGDCQHRTAVRDYGLEEYYWPRGQYKGWFRPDKEIYFCGEHWKRYRKMIARNHRPPEGMTFKPFTLKATNKCSVDCSNAERVR